MNPSLHQIRALLDSVQPDIATAIIDRLNGHPKAQAYDGDRTTNGDGPSDPTANAAITPDEARADLAKLEAAVVRAYTAMLCIAALSDRYEPAHEPRRGTIARDTRGCVWHDQAGIDKHHPAAHRTDFGATLKQPLPDPVDVCQACYDFVRTYKRNAEPASARPTNEELMRHHRTGKWTARTTGAFSVESIAATRPTTEVA